MEHTLKSIAKNFRLDETTLTAFAKGNAREYGIAKNDSGELTTTTLFSSKLVADFKKTHHVLISLEDLDTLKPVHPGKFGDKWDTADARVYDQKYNLWRTKRKESKLWAVKQGAKYG